jgi:hypothetical protein
LFLGCPRLPSGRHPIDRLADEFPLQDLPGQQLELLNYLDLGVFDPNGNYFSFQYSATTMVELAEHPRVLYCHHENCHTILNKESSRCTKTPVHLLPTLSTTSCTKTPVYLLPALSRTRSAFPGLEVLKYFPHKLDISPCVYQVFASVKKSFICNSLRHIRVRGSVVG